MAERKCVYDPLVEIMAYYADRKEVRDEVDRATLSVEERLRRRIVDGDQIGLDADLAEALRQYPPLEIINTYLLDGMKVVGELFGSGQMQLPFVLQSAETMKAAVAYLEPYMDKAEDTAKGTMVLATVKGDVHDIGKNLVDIILTNNGYRVINLGIKVPLETMLDAAAAHRANAIGMSGLLVKSTAIMKENLELMAGRGLEVPVVLGGAALTRRFVEHDLRALYANVVYAQDAFDGLRYMERIMAGEPVAGPEAESPAAAEATAAGAENRRRRDPRGDIRTRHVAELDDVAAAAELLPGDVPEDWAPYLAVELGERVVGVGRVRETSPGLWLIDELSMLPEQALSGAAIVLLRALRRQARAAHAEAEVLLSLAQPNPLWSRMLRTIGFSDIEPGDARAAALGASIPAGAALFASKPAGVLADESAAGMHEGRTGSEPGAIEDFQTDHNVRRLRVTSDVDRTIPVPAAPFYGARIVDDVRIEKVFEYINEVALIRGQWQIKRGGRTAEEYRRQLEEVVHPKLEEVKLRAKREALLQPRVIYGYYPCLADGDQLVIYRPQGVEGSALAREWPAGAIEAGAEEWLRFDFPRQPEGRRLCIADFFRPVDGARQKGEFDVVAFQIVTMGSRATEFANELFRTNNYADYLYFHGLSVESAEALAEYWHRSIRTELGIAGTDAPDLRRLFSQGYRGSRYSFGYPACPNLEDQALLFTMLEPERIGVALSEEFMLEPEQSTSAIVVHHPGAKYFNIREE